METRKVHLRKCRFFLSDFTSKPSMEDCTCPSLKECCQSWEDQTGEGAPCPICQEDYKTPYLELIYAVAQKFPGETRHQTALRYIRERENQPSGLAMVDVKNAH